LKGIRAEKQLFTIIHIDFAVISIVHLQNLIEESKDRPGMRNNNVLPDASRTIRIGLSLSPWVTTLREDTQFHTLCFPCITTGVATLGESTSPESMLEAVDVARVLARSSKVSIDDKIVYDKRSLGYTWELARRYLECRCIVKVSTPSSIICRLSMNHQAWYSDRKCLPEDDVNVFDTGGLDEGRHLLAAAPVANTDRKTEKRTMTGDAVGTQMNDERITTKNGGGVIHNSTRR
jgi:hypothetical protein